MKSYTNLEQSKKLVEILPLETADMFLAMNGTIPVMSKYIDDGLVTADETAIPCWSLVALLDILPNNENISTNLSKGGYKISTLEYTNSWFVEYEDETDYLNNYVASADNPVDACVEMIIHLNKLNLL